MQKLSDMEHGLITRVVESAKKIVNASAPTYEKVAKLQFASAEHVRRARRLMTLFESPHLAEKRKVRIEKLINLRLRCATYIRNLALTLRAEGEGKRSIRQLPRTFAEPRWTTREDSKQRLSPVPEMGRSESY